VSVGALISIAGTLNSTLLAGPRILFAMAEHGQLPRLLGLIHRRFHTPHIAILISATAMLVLTLQGSFISALTISTVIRLLAFIATCVALPVLRLKKEMPLPGFIAPSGVAVAFTATALCLWLLSNSPSTDARNAALAAAMGLVLFSLLSREKPDSYRSLVHANIVNRISDSSDGQV
jgi:amino acid transporter